MNDPDQVTAGTYGDMKGTILWLSGWSMPTTIFDRLRRILPDFYHESVDYSAAESPEQPLLLATKAAKELRQLGHSGEKGGTLLIAGWSLGGLLALSLAAQGLADGVVLFGATARFVRAKEASQLGWADGYVRRMIAGLGKDRETVESEFRRRILTEQEWEAGLDRWLPRAGSWTTPALIAGLQILRSEDCLPVLPLIGCPVLVLHGTEDHICPYGAASELTAQLRDAQLVSLSGCGHAPFLGKETFIAETWRSWWHAKQNKRDCSPI